MPKIPRPDRVTLTDIQLALPPSGLRTVRARSVPDSEYCIPVRRLTGPTHKPTGRYTLETFGRNDAWVRQQDIQIPRTRGFIEQQPRLNPFLCIPLDTPDGVRAVIMREKSDKEYWVPVYKRADGLYEIILVADAIRGAEGYIREQDVPTPTEFIPFTPETEGSTSMPNRSSDSELFAYVTAANGDNYRLTDSEVRRVIDYARQNYPALTWALSSDPLQDLTERTFTVKFSVDVTTYIRQQDSEKKPETDTPLGAGLIKHLRSRGLAISATPDGINIVSLARKIPAPEELD